MMCVSVISYIKFSPLNSNLDSATSYNNMKTLTRLDPASNFTAYKYLTVKLHC